MRKATVDVTVAPNLAPRRAIMSKSTALGLLGAGAILLCHTADRVFRCAKPHAGGWGRSHPHRRCTARSHTYAHHGSDTGTHSHTHTDGCATPTPAGPTIIPLGLAPPVPGSCGNGTYDTPVPVTGLLGGNKSPSWRSDCAEIAYVQGLGVSVMKRGSERMRPLWRRCEAGEASE